MGKNPSSAICRRNKGAHLGKVVEKSYLKQVPELQPFLHFDFGTWADL